MKIVFKTAFYLFIFFLVSCKKDKTDKIPPSVSISSPTNGQVFHMYDTLQITASISDDVQLVSVDVVLTDTNHIPVQNVQSVSLLGKDYNLSMKYVLSEFRLSTGKYIMQVSASDGYNTTPYYQPIKIIESPTIWLGYGAVLNSNQQNIAVYDSTKALNWNIPLLQNYNGMRFGGYNRELYVNGNNNMPFTAYDAIYKTPVYYVQATNNQYNYSLLSSDWYSPYVGYSNGDVYSYNNSGSQSTSYRYAGAYPAYAYYFAVTTTRNLAIYKSTMQDDDALVTFYETGAFYSSLKLFGNTPIKKVIGIFQKSADSLFVVGNDSLNEGIIDYYIFSGNSFSASPEIINEPILSAEQINSQYIVVSTPTQLMGCLGYSTPMMVQSGGAQKIKYQPKLNVLSCASSNNLSAYTFTMQAGFPTLTPNTKMSLTLSDSIFDFEIITNK